MIGSSIRIGSSFHKFLFVRGLSKSFNTRFVFRPVFVADGNFKADHVKQKNDNDIWLIDGGGMVPNKKDYSDF